MTASAYSSSAPASMRTQDRSRQGYSRRAPQREADGEQGQQVDGAAGAARAALRAVEHGPHSVKRLRVHQRRPDGLDRAVQALAPQVPAAALVGAQAAVTRAQREVPQVLRAE